MDAYFLSGLGADRRIFQRLKLPPHIRVQHLDYIAPLPHETLPHYAGRMAAFIDTSKPFVLVGLSFGGMVAVALNEFVQPQKTIVLSSAVVRRQIPFYFRWLGRLHLHRVAPAFLYQRPTRLLYWLFGTRSKSEKTLLQNIIRASDPRFLKWAVHALLTWRQHSRPRHLVHIHGNRDELLPLKYVTADYVIEGGRHFMVWSQAHNVSEVLAKELDLKNFGIKA